MLSINTNFFKKNQQLIFDRENLHLGAVANNESGFLERKILCQRQNDTADDILFDSPLYEIGQCNKYSVVELVSLNNLLKKLEYPRELQIRDIKFLYYFVLSSTRILYQNAELFGARQYDRGYKGARYFGQDPINHGQIPYEDFVSLETTLELSIKPTKEEKQSSDKTFKKKMFFIS